MASEDGSVLIKVKSDDSEFKSGLSKLGATAKTSMKAGTEAIAGVAAAADNAVTGLLSVERASEGSRMSVDAAEAAFKGLHKTLEDTGVSAESYQQKQRLVAESSELAAESLDTMETAASQLDGTLENSKLDDFNQELDLTGEKADHAARELSDFDPALKQVSDSAGDAAGGLGDVGDSADGLEEGFGAADVAIGTFVGGVMTKLLDLAIQAAEAIWNLDEATEEYRESMAMLNTAYETAGYSQETATEAYRGFFQILGETDRATEASQLLAQLATSSEDVAKWTDIAAGVYGTFGDSLPIESLIEAANETAKTGKVTGVLADALNWVGISEDYVNQQLSQLGDETSRAQLLMAMLSDEYSSAADIFYENNESIIAARDAQADMDESLGTLGQAVADMKTKFMDAFGPYIVEIINAVAAAIEFITPLIDGIAFAIGVVIDAVKTLVGWIMDAVNWFMELIGVSGESKNPSPAGGGGSGGGGSSRAAPARAAAMPAPAPADGPAGGVPAPVETDAGGSLSARSLTVGRSRVLQAMQTSMPAMEQRVAAATAAMAPASAYYDPFAAHRAASQAGQPEQGQSAAPQRVQLDIEFKPREAARFLKPHIDEETNRKGESLARGG